MKKIALGIVLVSKSAEAAAGCSSFFPGFGLPLCWLSFLLALKRMDLAL
jgi:hypothetical protein